METAPRTREKSPSSTLRRSSSPANRSRWGGAVAFTSRAYPSLVGRATRRSIGQPRRHRVLERPGFLAASRGASAVCQAARRRAHVLPTSARAHGERRGAGALHSATEVSSSSRFVVVAFHLPLRKLVPYHSTRRSADRAILTATLELARTRGARALSCSPISCACLPTMTARHASSVAFFRISAMPTRRSRSPLLS